MEEELHIEDWGGLGGRSVCVTTALPSSSNSIVAIIAILSAQHRMIDDPQNNLLAVQPSIGLPGEPAEIVDSLNGQTTLEKVNLSSR